VERLDSPRQACFWALRNRCKGDLWLTSYALFTAMEMLDLGLLTELVDQVLDAEEARAVKPVAFSDLFEERWG
jgi:hypothetical protein